jgi:Uma2 family endonuclease
MGSDFSILGYARRDLPNQYLQKSIMVPLSDRLMMSAEEYLAWELTQTERHEFCDGEVLAMSGSTRRHNRVSGNFFNYLVAALANRDCEVYISDVKVQVQANRKFFYPDVVVTCDPCDQDEQLVNHPCLIIEVLSPSTESFDRGVKFRHYRQFTALQEYVLVRIDEPLVEVYTKNAAGTA